jgi:hypothetical protein
VGAPKEWETTVEGVGSGALDTVRISGKTCVPYLGQSAGAGTALT